MPVCHTFVRIIMRDPIGLTPPTHAAYVTHPTRSTPPADRLVRAIAAFISLVVVTVLLWHFHDRFWYPSDEGIYASIAARVLSGEALNRDVQDPHPGFGAFLNAAAFWLFGVDLVSLRYPLVLAGLLQSGFVFLILARRSLLLAACGSVASAALGAIQFLNPTPNWYCLLFSIAVAWWLNFVAPTHRARLVGAGVLVGIVGLFRQLTGLWVAMAVVTLALVERQPDGGKPGRLAPALLIGMLLLLPTYLIVSRLVEPGAILFLALWPAMILAVASRRVRATNSQTLGVLLHLSLGATLAASPLLVYGALHHSLRSWIEDAMLSAFRLAGIVRFFEGGSWYAALSIAGLHQAATSLDAVKIVNGIYWTLVSMLTPVNGVLTVRRLWQGEEVSELVLPIVAAFYGLVSFFLQDAIYLYFTAGLNVAAVLWHVARHRSAVRLSVSAATALLSVVAVQFHAAQPATRSNVEMLEGRRTAGQLDAQPMLRCSLKLNRRDREPYERLVAIIQNEVPPGEPIFVLPSDPQLYFLSSRRNPLRFYSTAVGVRTERDLQQTLHILEQSRPRIVTFRPDDKFNTPASRTIMEHLRLQYALVETIGGIEVYRRRDALP